MPATNSTPATQVPDEPLIVDVIDLVNEARSLVEAVFLAAGSLGDRTAKPAIQIVCNEADFRLVAVREKLEAMLEAN